MTSPGKSATPVRTTTEAPPPRAYPRRGTLHPFVVVVAVVAFMYLAREALIPLAFAIVLSLIWSAPVAWLQKLHFNRTAAALVVVILSVAAAGNVGWIIFNQLVAVVNGLPDYRQNIHEKVAAFRNPSKGSLSEVAQNVQQIGKEISAPAGDDATLPAGQVGPRRPRVVNNEPLPVTIVEPATTAMNYLEDVASRFMRPVEITGVVLIFALFLLIERLDVRNRFLRLVGLSQLNVITQALDDATQRVSRYLLLQTAVNAMFGVLVGVGLHLIGLPFASLWGTVAGLLRFVPYLGTLAAGLLPLILSVAVFNGWAQPAMVFALFAVLEIIIGNWVEPLLYGAHTGVSSLAILVTTVFWTILWGPAGLILATPLTVCVAVLGRYVPQLSFLHIMLGDEQVLTEDAQFYQRLLAMDQTEAQDITRKYLSAHSLPEFYDRVVLPALLLAEIDRHKGALEEERERFIFLSVREMVVELSEDYVVDSAAIAISSEVSKPRFAGRALCVPCADEADEISAAILAQLLSAQGISSVAFPLHTKTYEMFELLQLLPEDVICLSALPPFALAQTLSVARQFRLKFPQTKLIVGVWGYSGDMTKALARFGQTKPDGLFVSMTEVLGYFEA